MDPVKEHIYQAYNEFIAENRRRPSSIDTFLGASGIESPDFHKSFERLKDVEIGFWTDTFEATRQQLESEEIYKTYSIREKLLAFYFTWIEYLKLYRDYVRWAYEQAHIWEMWPSSMHSFQKQFTEYANELVREGKMTEEVADRPIVTDYYGKWLWMQVQFIVKFWLRDTSADFQNTDAAVEKAVNFAMDMINSNYVDSFFGLSKFVIQKW